MLSTNSVRALMPRALQIPNGAIVGIAAGGAILLFGILVIIALFYVRRKHQWEKSRMSELEGGGHVDMDRKSTARNTRPPESNFPFSRRLSFNPFMPLDDDPIYPDWTGEDGLQSPPKSKIRRLSSQKPLFRRSGMRDSWPLVSNIPLSLMPGQSSSNIMLSNVAAPGYEIPQEPKWPKRTASRKNSRITVSVPRDVPRKRSPSSDLYSPAKSPRRIRPHRRSTSENHLSTILRSTSQRLKSTKNPLTRTLTTLNRDPGFPPLGRLPTPPKGKGRPTESREALIDSDHDDSVASSVYDLLRSPSPARRSPRHSDQISVRRAKSPTPSAGSDDSLCAAATPDLIIPAPLTSPSKNGLRGEQRHSMRIPSGCASDISTLIHKDGRALTSTTGGPLDLRRAMSLSSPPRISRASDPFYSQVRSAKPIIPDNKVQGPRPLYTRKATFGQEATSTRPRSFVTPLKNISGNVQTRAQNPIPPPHSSTPVSVSPNPELNPFQWAPQETMQTHATQTSPYRRKGHKRSKVVRISQLPRPSSVTVVPEEPEEDMSRLKFHVPYDPLIRFIEPIKSPSPAPTSKEGRRVSGRPPSAAIFNPSLTTHDLTGRSGDSSPTLGMEEIMNMYSPTLASDYYTESSGASEDEFFAKRSSSQSSSKSFPRHLRTYSNELFLFPSSSPLGKLVSFPPPDLKTQQSIITPPNLSPRPLPSISAMTAPPCMQSTAATPLPPLLTIPIPGHLTGPRAEPSRRSCTLSPPRNSLQASIGMLRRMNSEASSSSSTLSTPTSHHFPLHYPGAASMANFASAKEPSSPTDDQHERGRSRGSKHYLSIGKGILQPPSLSSQARSQQRPRRGAEKRDSHRVYKERKRRRNEEIENDITSGLTHELTPVKEVSSPATGTDTVAIGSELSVGLRFPALTSARTVGTAPPSSRQKMGMMVGIGDSVEFNVSVEEIAGDKEEQEKQQFSDNLRWSDAMPKPTSHATRRESKMEHPSPKTPPKWVWGLGGINGGLGLATSRLKGVGGAGGKSPVEEGEWKENEGEGDGERPRSLGLYDQDGFLRTSPDREGALERGNAKSWLKD